MRKFERCKGFENVVLPRRSTKKSAGYDFTLNHDVFVPAGKESEKIVTGIKACMNDDEFLGLHIRSSIGIKMEVIIANIQGIIDADYYNNPDNEGNIMIILRNLGNKDATLHKGDRVVQGIFQKYLLTDDDDSDDMRKGGLGSSN